MFLDMINLLLQEKLKMIEDYGFEIKEDFEEEISEKIKEILLKKEFDGLILKEGFCIFACFSSLLFCFNALLPVIVVEFIIVLFSELKIIDGLIEALNKAKNLKKRVTSYFTKEHDTYRLRTMVKKIVDIKTIKVDTEMDALILENNLIKSLHPKYNVMLRDDKTYPWICIKKEAFPRVFSTRKMIKDGSEYFGP